ncbi:MAG: hypothetical protein ACYTGW_09105 [Planctomycetota bacterium]|jgi:hypothetical protein
MSEPKPPLEIHVHLNSGAVRRFEQKDREQAEQMLAALDPGKFFGEKGFTIAGEHHTTSFPAGTVSRVEFLTDEPPDWEFVPHNIKNVVLMTQEQFEHRVAAIIADGSINDLRKTPEGEEFVGYASIEMANREAIYVGIHGVAMPETLRGGTIARFLSMPSFHAHREGVLVLINMASVVSLSAYPGPAEITYGALRADVIWED